jgi:3-oxoacyl-[acyl-carrier protein] reductase
MLKNKIAVVTGANGGIGIATVKLFHKNGAKIFACVRSENAELNQVKKELEQNNSNKIEIIKLDLKDQSSIKKASSEIINKTDSIDILVNNAAQIFTSLFLMTPIEKIRDLFEVNFFSQLLFTQYMIKKMMKKKSGSIINISSSSAIEANPGRIAYASSKSALVTSSKVMARELANFNIRCNVVSPGLTDTKMMRDSHTEENIKNKIDSLMIKRAASPNEIANAIMFLASEQSSYITGQVIKVDGGL